MPVRIGLGLTDSSFSGAKAFWRWVGLCEEGGVDSLWQSDRLTGPLLECMSVMAALAGATKRLKFGMSVLSLGMREPLIVAKECATIDYLSDGRLLPAFGVGSPASPDWKALGLEGDGHGGRVNQALGIIERLWRGESVDTDGPHFRYRGAQIAPLPVQQPLPLWIGGSSPAAVRRTARYGTGWISGLEGPRAVAVTVAAIKAAAEEAGRPMDPEHFGAGFFFRFGREDEPIVEARRAQLARLGPDVAIAAGGPEEILAMLRKYRAGGVTKFVLRPIGAGDDDVFAQTRQLIETVIPAVHKQGAAD